FTWLAYFMLAYYAYLQAALGPLMPFLAAELDLSYTLRGLHFSAFALGMVIAGSSADRAVKHFGRAALFWGGGAGMAVGALILTAGHTAALTIFGSFMMGAVGSYLLVMIQATLADHHGPGRAIALTESNVGASAAAMLAPLMISQSEHFGLSWRLAIIMGILAWFAALASQFRLPIPQAPQNETPENPSKGKLPVLFWFYWAVVLLGVSAEWSTVFWGADFLENAVGLSRVDAAAAMTLFFAAAVLGRWIGSRLSRAIAPSKLLLTASFILLIGFPIFWFSRSPITALPGLFLMGLGIANLFPMTLSIITNLVPKRANTASARISLAAGLAILVTPQILGSTADQIGIQSSFGIVGLLALGVVMIVWLANRAAARRYVS
ncbi:MAG: MFS transporter, partial [Anaerolineae bacterium]|nr:MFS transporter [Anaerolineae bacterium]